MGLANEIESPFLVIAVLAGHATSVGKKVKYIMNQDILKEPNSKCIVLVEKLIIHTRLRKVGRGVMVCTGCNI